MKYFKYYAVLLILLLAYTNLGVMVINQSYPFSLVDADKNHETELVER